MAIHFDHTAGVYEVFAYNGEWLGAFDSYAEAADSKEAAAAREQEVDLIVAAQKKRDAMTPMDRRACDVQLDLEQGGC